MVERADLPILEGLGYQGPYAFNAKVLKDARVDVIELDRVYRQEEQEFVDLLVKIRVGEDIEEAIRILNERCVHPHRAGVIPILLTPTRAAAERYGFTFEGMLIAAQAWLAAKSTKPDALMDALRKMKIDQHVMVGGPIQFDAKGQNVNIKAAAVENFKRKPTVVMPLDSAAAPLVFPMPGWNDKRRT